MADINRVGSPMDLLDENIVEAPDKVLAGKKSLQKKQQTKSPFLIGSIEEVSRKISQLDHRLQDYMQLVCESRASEGDEAVVMSNRARGVDQHQQRERDKKEINKFAGVYTLKSTLVPNLSPRAKKISKISISDKLQQSAVVNKEDSCKPKLVELHLYPGYDPQEPTPLPGCLDPNNIFNKVVDASVNLNKKHRPIFDQLFFSHISQAILLDIFWYLFLEKFQFNKDSQQKLFNRTAHNYVSLLMSSSDPVVKDKFLKDYPRLMSQAVYSAFCFSFPDSYRQFGEKFKDDLVYLVYGWMTGIRPPPRSWALWDMPSLEPPNLKQREEMMNRKNNKKGRPLVDFDYLDSLSPSPASQNASTVSRSMSQSTSKSSAASLLGSRRSCSQTGTSKVITEKPLTYSKPLKEMPLSGVTPRSCQASSSKPQFPVSPQDSSSKTQFPVSPPDSSIIRAVGEAQGNPEARRSPRNGGVAQASKSLMPIQEMTREGGDLGLIQKSLQTSESQVKGHRKTKESHPAGKGCDFVHTVFNLVGKSPLVEHFLQMKGLERDAGCLVWVHRVQVENLPSIGAPTYQDVIADSTKNIRSMKKIFLERHRENLRASRVSINEQRAILKEHIHKQASLLSNEKEVKRLSDLIIMEQRRSSDSVMAGADAAITAALMAQD